MLGARHPCFQRPSAAFAQAHRHAPLVGCAIAIHGARRGVSCGQEPWQTLSWTRWRHDWQLRRGWAAGCPIAHGYSVRCWPRYFSSLPAEGLQTRSFTALTPTAPSRMFPGRTTRSRTLLVPQPTWPRAAPSTHTGRRWSRLRDPRAQRAPPQPDQRSGPSTTSRAKHSPPGRARRRPTDTCRASFRTRRP